MLASGLQRRLSAAGAQTIALAAHPGTARTDLTRHMSAVSNGALSPQLKAVNFWMVQDGAMGALPTLRAATDPAAIGGTYYGPDGLLQMTGYPVDGQVERQIAVARGPAAPVDRIGAAEPRG